MAKMGRPTLYNNELAELICRRIAEGESLRGICSSEGMPTKHAVLDWLNKYNDFAAQYTRAREVQADSHFDDIISLADTADRENAHAVRVMVDARKWVVSKMAPKKYGDKIDVNHSGELHVGTLSEHDLDQRLRQLATQAGVSLALGGEGEEEAGE